jgi:uncharacterized damage-inducible protein DinB
MTGELAALGSSVVDAWNTVSRATVFLVEGVPEEIWGATAPNLPRRTIRSIAAHLHNSRRRWIRTLGEEHGVRQPERVDERRVTRRALAAALRKSGAGMERLFVLGAERGGALPVTKLYTWRNLPLDLGHVLAYFSAHEGHHRGQIVMLAKQMGHPLPREVLDGLWQFARFARERNSGEMTGGGGRARKSRGD